MWPSGAGDGNMPARATATAATRRQRHEQRPTGVRRAVVDN